MTARKAPRAPRAVGQDNVRGAIAFLESLSAELETLVELRKPNPYLNIASHLMLAHLEGRTVTPSSAVAAAGVPYATAVRRLAEMSEAGYVDHRPRKSGKTFTIHPSEKLIARWQQLSDRLPRLVSDHLGLDGDPLSADYYFQSSYRSTQVIPSPRALAEPLRLAGGLRTLVHSDPTFMVMGNLKRQFEQFVGCTIHQRAFSIDRLRQEALLNAQRRSSLYDIIAVDLPWIGEFAAGGHLLPLPQLMDVARLDPADFHPAGWQAAHWDGVPYAVPNQTTPELLFYRTDLFAELGLPAPTTVERVLEAAAKLHEPSRGRYGIAWNGARGTALGHTFMMTAAAFGQPILDLPPIAGGFDASALARTTPRPTLDTPRGLDAARYLLELLRFSPPDILSMSWYERVRPYAAGKVAMAYGYTLLAPYFELDAKSPANANTGYLPHPSGGGANSIAPVGGYVLGVPANVAPERLPAIAEALISFTEPAAQKLYVLSGSRTVPRYSVGADPEVRALSPLFEAVETMTVRDELQFWPRPPIPQINAIIQICGEELHDMLRGIATPQQALARAQARAEAALDRSTH